MKTTAFGIGGWKKPTPVWAAKLSLYLMFASIGLYCLEGLIMDWSEFIPETSKIALEAYLSSIEKSMVTIGTFVRFFYEKETEPLNENMYGIPHDNG